MSEFTTIYIDNMVCDRCKQAVSRVAANLGWRIQDLELGRLRGIPPGSTEDLQRLKTQLESLGFTLRQDYGGAVSRIKGLIVAFVYDDLADSSVTLSKLITDDIGQSYPHLSRLFRRVEGRTIADYYLAQRVERARHLLVTTEEPISSIAYRLHYGTPGRFAAAFREVTGCSPTEYRERGEYAPVPLDRI